MPIYSSARPAFLFGTLLLFVLVVVLLVVSPRDNAAARPFAGADSQAPSRSPAVEAAVRETQDQPEFKKAGVCARCHVLSVLEWGVSRHLEEQTDCKACHGPSLEHVANERNQVKPDRLPRGQAIAKQACMTCHDDGCPETFEVVSCQKCHHVHALINPSKPPTVKDDRLTKLLAHWTQFQKKTVAGEQHIQRKEWKAAGAAFHAALELIPGNHHARKRMEMCTRRLNPNLPGFTINGERFDPQTGLPREVSVAGREIPMLLVPPGTFDMGSDDLADSRPVHSVPIDAFYLGRYEITQAQWKVVMGTNPSLHQGADFPDAERMPVEHISWNDCREFIRRLNQRVPGGGFRLPTEAEWEYACRAGHPINITREPPNPEFAGSGSKANSKGRLWDRHSVADEERLAEFAWFRANSLKRQKTRSEFLSIDAYAPQAVGTRRPNAWGFGDMQGNVWEWCSSLWRPYLYQATDGRESLVGEGLRVLRGGSFSDSATSLDSALRHAERPHRRLRWNGLRLARSVPSPQLPIATEEATKSGRSASQ